MSKFIKCKFIPGQYNNYLIAGTICNAFALGEIGSTDDFFLVGAEPENESNYPLLTGNILDSSGNVLFRLVRNVLIINPGNCSRILSDHIGFEIHDSNNNLILKLKTTFEKLPDGNEEMFVTTIEANFYDKTGKLVFKAHSGEEGENIDSTTKTIFGFSGGSFGFVGGMSGEELDFLRHVLSSGGKVNQLVKGRIQKEELSLDGKAFINAEVLDSKIHIKTGDFSLVGSKFQNCEFIFEDEAANVQALIMLLQQQ